MLGLASNEGLGFNVEEEGKMDKLLHFIDSDDNSLFSAPSDAMPRAGDAVRYSMEARDGEKWNADAWEGSLELSGKEWTVERVCHDFRRMSVDSTAHVVMLVLKPNVRADAGPTAKRQARAGENVPRTARPGLVF